jgi:hypothetical protein
MWGATTDINQNVYSIVYVNSSTRRFYNADTTLASTSSEALGGGVGSFLVKYNQNGNFEWYTRCDGSQGTVDDTYGVWAESMKNVTTQQYVSNVYQVFSYAGSGNVFSASNQITAARTLVGASTTVSDMGIAKFDSNGTVHWATRISGTSAAAIEIGRAVIGDNTGNVYVVGYYNGTSRIYSASNQGTPAFQLGPVNGTDIMIVKYDINGTFLWCSRMSCLASGETIKSAAVDNFGNLYLAGSHSTAMGVYQWTGATTSLKFTLAFVGTNDGFIVKYNFNGTCAWATRVAGQTAGNNDTIAAIATTPEGNCYVHGTTTSLTLNIYTINSPTNTSTIAASLTAFSTVSTGFIIKYDTNGTYKWSAKFGKASTASIAAQNVAVDKNGDIYGTGWFSDTVAGSKFIDFYNQGGSSSAGRLTATATSDGFLWKYNSDGVYKWSGRMSGTTGLTNPASLSIRNNAVYVGGYCTSISGSFTLYSASGVAFANTLTTSTGSGFTWMAKYSY